MERWVREKLDTIRDLYPPERVERSKERYRSVYRGEPPKDRYPFVYSPASLDYYDAIHSPEERLRLSLDEHILRGGGAIGDDFIPSLFPGCRQVTIPDMFTAAARVRGGDACARVIHELSDIDDLPAPSLAAGTYAHQWLEMQKYFVEETEGEMPVHVVDMQGPVEVCAKMWGYDEFFITAYSEPDYCHKFMDRLTDAFIMFWEAQQNLLGDHFVGTHLWGWNWVPEGSGATLSADGIVMVSPNFFDEFFLPSIVRVGEYFGGVTAHSCGDFSHIVDRLLVPALVTGIHAGQMPIHKAVEAGFDSSKVFIGPTNVGEAKDTYEIIRREKLRAIMTIYSLWPSSAPAEWSRSDRQAMQSEHERILDVVATP